MTGLAERLLTRQRQPQPEPLNGWHANVACSECAAFRLKSAAPPSCRHGPHTPASGFHPVLVFMCGRCRSESRRKRGMERPPPSGRWLLTRTVTRRIGGRCPFLSLKEGQRVGVPKVPPPPRIVYSLPGKCHPYPPPPAKQPLLTAASNLAVPFRWGCVYCPPPPFPAGQKQAALHAAVHCSHDTYTHLWGVFRSVQEQWCK